MADPQQNIQVIQLRSQRRRLIWHRYRDLRLHDNLLYQKDLVVASVPQEVGEDTPQHLSVFVFDDADFAPRPSTTRPNQWNAIQIGPHASRILLQSVEDLRKSLRFHGSDLVIRRGKTVDILIQLVHETQATEVCWNEEPGTYEQERSHQVRQAMHHEFPHMQIYTTLDCTLYHPDDLPRNEEWQHLAHPIKKKRVKKGRLERTAETKNRHEQAASDNTHCVDISASRFQGMPNVMGDFRRAAQEAGVRSCLDTPHWLLNESSKQPEPGKMPTLAELLEQVLALDASSTPIMGMPVSMIHEICQWSLKLYHQAHQQQLDVSLEGGETSGLARLTDFCQHHASSAQRNLACVDDHQSSRLSHHLAFGSLSPRRIVEEAEKQHASQRKYEKGSSGCDWLIHHMTMRDFFLYSCIVSGAQFYQFEGIPISKKNAESIAWKCWDESETIECWEAWAVGNTGLPLVDAAMTELMQTGYCSNRVRQNAASVLTKDLGVDWRAGAEWFQFLLCDHCVAANWGNWLYFSGKGSDPKNRHFRTVSQALKYDKYGVYVKKWLPDLVEFITKVESSHSKSAQKEIHLRPWDFNTADAQWKETIFSPQTQYTWQDLERLENESQLVPLTGTKREYSKQEMEQWIPMMNRGAFHSLYQLINLAALQKLNEILRAADIEYWASGGTLLGALRHQGFILHDDDIDIECHSADVERLASIVVDEYYLGLEKGGVWKGFPVFKMKFRGDVSIDVFLRKDIWNPKEDALEAKYFPSYNEVFPLKTVPFSNVHISIPNSHDFLRRLYGKDCFENVLVWNHDFNFEHGKGFDQRKVVVPLHEYNALLEDCGIRQPVAGKTAEETYGKAFGSIREEEYLAQMQSYKMERTLRWNRADAEWRYEQQQKRQQ